MLNVSVGLRHCSFFFFFFGFLITVSDYSESRRTHFHTELQSKVRKRSSQLICSFSAGIRRRLHSGTSSVSQTSRAGGSAASSYCTLQPHTELSGESWKKKVATTTARFRSDTITANLIWNRGWM